MGVLGDPAQSSALDTARVVRRDGRPAGERASERTSCERASERAIERGVHCFGAEARRAFVRRSFMNRGGSGAASQTTPVGAAIETQPTVGRWRWGDWGDGTERTSARPEQNRQGAGAASGHV